MGMDLSGKDGDFHFNNTTWRMVLTLAIDHGWKPAGTEPPEPTFFREDGTVDEEMTEAYRQAYEDWNAANYYTNDFQLVTDEDAANIADALERALSHVPDEETIAMKAATTSSGGVPFDVLKHLTPLDWCSGVDGKARIREFIDFCRTGAFCIF
jgi:hypothetical protein